MSDSLVNAAAPGSAALSRQERRWRTALEQGAFGVWDLNPIVEMVHYSPQWKQRLGFPGLEDPDATSFWRCRVHPDDLAPMMAALRAHLDGFSATYEMRFRLRSNGSGYRTMLSRGRVVERDPLGSTTRMVGTMVDLTHRPASPFVDPLGVDGRSPLPASAAVPLHALLGVRHPLLQRSDAGPSSNDAVRQRLLARVEDLLDAAADQVVAPG